MRSAARTILHVAFYVAAVVAIFGFEFLRATPAAGDIRRIDVPGIGPGTGHDVLRSCSNALSIACTNAAWSVHDGAMQAHAICPVGNEFSESGGPELAVVFYLVLKEPDLDRSAHDVILDALRWRFPCS